MHRQPDDHPSNQERYRDSGAGEYNGNGTLDQKMYAAYSVPSAVPIQSGDGVFGPDSSSSSCPPLVGQPGRGLPVALASALGPIGSRAAQGQGGYGTTPPPTVGSGGQLTNSARDRKRIEEWVINVPGGGQLGIDVIVDDDQNIVIDSITSGTIATWNMQHPDMQVKIGDSLVEVNGITSGPQRMVNECKKHQMVQIRVSRVRDNWETPARAEGVQHAEGQWQSAEGAAPIWPEGQWPSKSSLPAGSPQGQNDLGALLGLRGGQAEQQTGMGRGPPGQPGPPGCMVPHRPGQISVIPAELQDQWQDFLAIHMEPLRRQFLQLYGLSSTGQPLTQPVPVGSASKVFNDFRTDANGAFNHANRDQPRNADKLPLHRGRQEHMQQPQSKAAGHGANYQ